VKSLHSTTPNPVTIFDIPAAQTKEYNLNRKISLSRTHKRVLQSIKQILKYSIISTVVSSHYTQWWNYIKAHPKLFDNSIRF